MELTIQDRTIYYQVHYTKGTKEKLELTPEGHVTVSVPVNTPMWQIEKLVMRHKNKILKKYDALENRQYISSRKIYEEDENFLYLGALCKLSDILPEGSNLASRDEIELTLKKFYTKQTKKIIKKRVSYYEKIIGVSPKSVTIVDTRGSWGTCNSLKELTFNYRLSMAPLESIDYVVIHELCHIYHMNHDRSFWRKVGSYDKYYKEHAAFLERYGMVMTI